MVRLRFHASWLPDDHNQFWIVLDETMNIKTIDDLIEYFNEQQKSLADYYQFHLPKRSTKLKYLKAFVNDSILPPHAQAKEILRDNDEVNFRLEIDAQNEWLLIKSSPTSKRKRSVESELPSNDLRSVQSELPPSSDVLRSVESELPPSNDLDDVLRSMAQSTKSPEKSSFTFQFGNKRGRPIPPRPQVISAAKVNSLVPRQVLTHKK